METPELIASELQALESLNSALPKLFDDALSREQLARIVDKGVFSPAEDEEISYWFARFLTVRNNLWTIVNTAIYRTGGTQNLLRIVDWQYFLMAYSAICSIVRLDRFLITKVAIHSDVQRKLNEAMPLHRVERKQYTSIYKALYSPANITRIHDAHRTFRRNKRRIENAVDGHAKLELLLEQIPKQERYIDLSWRRYFVSWFLSRRHSWRRRGASAKQKSLFTMLEYSGRFVAEIKMPRTKKVTAEVRQKLLSILQPGDIFVTRHRQALTNLFLPGYWPHSALYVGPREQYEPKPSESNYLDYWQGDNVNLEAQKDGVRFRSLDETLSVDAFVVIRPSLTKAEIENAIARAITHAGKGYNFDFDFFRSDQLVCTEVVYRAYDGIGGKNIPLTERMGRMTLSAEDLLDLSLDTDWVKPVAIYGVNKSKTTLITGPQVREVLEKSYRNL